METWGWRPALLRGLLILLLAHHVVLTQQQEVLFIPAVAPYPPLKPFDTGYPGNIPANLSTQLPPAPAVLSPGTNTTCSTTVSEVLEANNRTLLAQYLAATPQGLLVLSGTMRATVLAPTDSALKSILASNENGLQGPAAASTVALYHVLNGRETLDKLGEPWGRWWNTTLTKAVCPTASQAITVFSGPQALYARSATNTARISTGDLVACNSIVHLADQALQPCCVSLFEELHQISIVKIQPSVFEGYKAEEPAGNSDAFNRRLFEEAMLDLVLFAGPLNKTRTLLWPAATAWDDFSLESLIPGVAVDNTTRAQAMQLLAMYSASHAKADLPQDVPGPDGTAPAVRFPFDTALRNMTARALWGCDDTLEVSSPAWGGSSSVQDESGTPAAATQTAVVGSLGSNSSVASATGLELTPSSTLADQELEHVVRLTGGQLANDEQQGQVAGTVANEETSSGETAQQPHRKLQSAAAGLRKGVNVLNTYQTCEGIRVLVVGAVPVPCDFASLVQNFGSIQSVVDKSYTPKEHKTLAAAVFEWLQQNGVITPGQKVSDVQQQQKHWPWQRSSAGDVGLHHVHRQLGAWFGAALLVGFFWGFPGC